jgi:hypothetical protein
LRLQDAPRRQGRTGSDKIADEHLPRERVLNPRADGSKFEPSLRVRRLTGPGLQLVTAPGTSAIGDR